MLEARWGAVKRIVVRQYRTTALQLLMGRTADPFSGGRGGQAERFHLNAPSCHCAFLLKRVLRIQSTHPAGAERREFVGDAVGGVGEFVQGRRTPAAATAAGDRARRGDDVSAPEDPLQVGGVDLIAQRSAVNVAQR